MKKFLMILEEQSGGNSFVTQHTIQAEDRQQVKYHFHRTLKDWGYNDTQLGKHMLRGPHDMIVEIEEIREIPDDEWRVLNKHLNQWTKV